MLKAEIIGHLGNDCIVNNVNGKTVVNFSVAHSDKWLNANGEQKERTVWVSCSYWSEKTNVANYLKRGTQVYVEGIPDVKLYKDRQGDMIPQLTMRVQSIQLLGGNQNNQQPKPQTQSAPSATVMDGSATEFNEASDLPF